MPRVRSSILTLTLLLSCSLASSSFAVTFTKVTTGPVVNDHGDSRSANFADYDNDGWLDLFISNGPQAGAVDYLYHNNGDGTFTRILGDPVATVSRASDGGSFGDIENDGDLDLFVATWWNQLDMLYLNNGNGTFTQVTTGPVVTENAYGEAGSWADYDSDGFIDLYICNSAGAQRNFLFHNNGNGTFTKILTGPQSTDANKSRVGVWGDYDNDGDLDLYVANETSTNDLYRNNGDGSFTKILTGAQSTDIGESFTASWGDYDNDGYLDLYASNWSNQNAFLYHNNGDGTFTKILGDPVVSTGGFVISSSWADIDNDADLDLFVTNAFNSAFDVNYLFINNGNGSFTRDMTAPVGTDMGWGYGCAFGDLDKDGDLDLAVAKCLGASENNALYLNDGNSNHWLSITPIGVVSNRDAIGARVRIKATINGSPLWQMREITSQSGYAGQNSMDAHFGLGDATTVDSMIIRWPSGKITTYANLPVDQFLTYEECPSDLDGDGVRCDDNCPTSPNPLQEDANNDGIGDACCCMGSTGNVDCDLTDAIDIADLTTLIDHLFITFAAVCCPNEANIDGSGTIDIGDLTTLIDHLFITFTPTVSCP